MIRITKRAVQRIKHELRLRRDFHNAALRIKSVGASYQLVIEELPKEDERLVHFVAGIPWLIDEEIMRKFGEFTLDYADAEATGPGREGYRLRRVEDKAAH